MAVRVLLLVGTRKGAFILESDAGRADWRVRGPLCEGFAIHDMAYDPSDGAILAGGQSPWYGPLVWRSEDLGATWTHSGEGLGYGEDGPALKTIWSVTPDPGRGLVYAGVEPAGLFRSTDGGRSWAHVDGLRQHPSTPEWQPGNGGLILHTIVPHPTDDDRLWVGISAVGVFATEDGGRTWQTRNQGVRADYSPDPYPEFGQCVHKLVLAHGGPDGATERLYQQNHCGVYRSDDGGRQWQRLDGNGLPSQFGFPMVVHPGDRETVFTIPLNGDDKGRFMPDGQAAVWRTRDGGASWQRLADGLPQEHAYLGVLREAMAIDRLDSAGVYFGTSNGQLWASADEGVSWRRVLDTLPPIWSVDAVVLD
ncbi:MAG TPA: hypothetical protein VFK38_00080 [Candidatus Limnocylindrales bacterium]|nr:hypothetical protein [Candidatus Limnocylindrales bacterium]